LKIRLFKKQKVEDCHLTSERPPIDGCFLGVSSYALYQTPKTNEEKRSGRQGQTAAPEIATMNHYVGVIKKPLAAISCPANPRRAGNQSASLIVLG